MTDAILQMIMARTPGMPPVNLADTLTMLAQQDPRMGPLLQQFQARLAASESAAPPVPEDDDTGIPLEPEIVEPKREVSREQKLRKLAKLMLTELQTLRARNEKLADALGACHLCWGQDEDCVYCSGQGRVGAYLIDAKVFEDVIGPACRQIVQRPPLVKPQTVDKGERSHAGLRSS